MAEDRIRIAQVRIDVGRGAVGATDQQRVCVRQDDRVVVDVDDSGCGIDLLGNLVDVALGWQAGPDIDELADSRFGEGPDCAWRKARLSRAISGRSGIWV